MRQIRITTKNLNYPQSDDCVLDENDPIHQIRQASFLGGLGTGATMSQFTSELVKKYWKKEGDDMAKM